MGLKHWQILENILPDMRSFFWNLYIVILTENGRLKDVCSLDYLEEEVPKLARV